MLHIARQPETILTKDGDLVIFVHDRIISNFSGEITVKPNETGSDMATVDTSNLPVAGNRILLCSRLKSGMVVANGFRACLYYNEVDNYAQVLRETINPKVTYDMDSNIIHLWFWTNFKKLPPDNLYNDDSEYLLWINEDTFANRELTTVYRALCYTVGTLQYGYINNGFASGDPTSKDIAKDGYDVIPIFKKPKIAQYRKIKKIPIVDFGGIGADPSGGGGGVTTSITRIPYYVS